MLTILYQSLMILIISKHVRYIKKKTHDNDKKLLTAKLQSL